MDIENLQVGQVLKNYKELCRILKITIKSGYSKICQLKDLNRYISYSKEGNKFIIDEIYDKPKPKVDKRSNGNNKNSKYFEGFKLSKKQYNNIGVYYIILNNNIYIGSTKNGFRRRFLQHYRGQDKTMQHTYDLLHNGGTFNILYDMNEIKDIELIRTIETEYINYFRENSKYSVINKISGWDNKKSKYKIKNIKIREDNYTKALELLIKNNLIEVKDTEVKDLNTIKFNNDNIPF